jgi:hypothetical protein
LIAAAGGDPEAVQVLHNDDRHTYQILSFFQQDKYTSEMTASRCRIKTVSKCIITHTLGDTFIAPKKVRTSFP